MASVLKQFEIEAKASVSKAFGEIELIDHQMADSPKMLAEKFISDGVPFSEEGEFFVARDFMVDGAACKIAVIRGYGPSLSGLGCFMFANFA